MEKNTYHIVSAIEPDVDVYFSDQILMADPSARFRFDASGTLPMEYDYVERYFTPDDTSELTLLDLLQYTAISCQRQGLSNNPTTIMRWNTTPGPIKVWLNEAQAPPNILASIRKHLSSWQRDGTPYFVEVDYDPTKDLKDNGVFVTYGIDEYGHPNPYSSAGAIRRADGSYCGLVNLVTDFQKTVIHEFGHLLGMRHTRDTRSIMTYLASPQWSWTPTTFDQQFADTLQQLPPTYDLSPHLVVDGRISPQSAVSEKAAVRYATSTPARITFCRQ